MSGQVGSGFSRPPEMEQAPGWRDMSDEEKKVYAVGICCYNLLGLVATAAFICGVFSFKNCDFVSRYVTISDEYVADANTATYTKACTELGYDSMGTMGTELCSAMLQSHWLGFTCWTGIIPVNQRFPFSYIVPTPWGVVTPNFDTAFNASYWFSILAYVFGGAAWFTLMCSSCCRMDQSRLRGICCYFWIACLFEGLSLLMLQSNACEKGFFQSYLIPADQANNQTVIDNFNAVVQDVSCGLSQGSRNAIAACVLYFVCSMMVPFSIVPFYEQRYYQEQLNNGPGANNNGRGGGGYSDQQQQQQQPQAQPYASSTPPPPGQGPIVQGQAVAY